MRVMVIEKTVYKFNELTDNAKDNARNWMRSADDFSFHAEHVIDDAKSLGALMGIDIKNVYYSGFSSQGDGACFEGSYRYKKGSVNAIKKECPKDTDLHDIVKGLQQLQSKHNYNLTTSVVQRGHYSHSNCTSFDVSRADRSRYDSVTDDTEQELKDLLRSYMDYIYKRLWDTYEWSMSNEVIDENIECNEYEFDENGRIA